MTIPIQSLMWLLIFLLGLEAFQMELIIILALFFASMLVKKNNQAATIRLTREFVLLTLAFVSYYFIMLMQHRFTFSPFYIVRYMVGASMAYIIGDKVCEGKDDNLLKLIKIIAISCLLHGMLNLSISSFSVSSRYATNIWTGEKVSSTLQGTYFTVATALAAYWMVAGNLKEKIAGFLIVLSCVWNSMLTATRTPFYMIAITFVAAFFLKEYGKKNKKYFLFVVVRSVIGLGILGVLLCLAYRADLFSIQTKFSSSFLGMRLAGISKEVALSRPELWVIAIKHIITYPLGGIREHYAHNLWLDFGVNAGVIPFILLLLFSLSSFLSLIKYLKLEKTNKYSKFLVLLTFFAMNLHFMVEPILESTPFMFFMYCMICGALSSAMSASR